MSERDHAAFTPLFDRYSKGVGKIHYGTLNDLVEEVLNESGDLRQLALNTLTGHRSTSILPSNTRKVLLIDEVDVFFSENFYGQTYNPVAYFSSEETIAMMNHIWTTRSSVRLSDIQQLPSYRGLIQRFSPEVTPLIDQHIRMMIEDAKDFNNPPYTVTPDGKNIGYVIGDSMETELLSFDYRTPFAYLHEVSRHPAMNETIPTVLAIQIPCGRFSYAEIPLEKTLNAHQKPVFECILGVTGISTYLLYSLIIHMTTL